TIADLHRRARAVAASLQSRWSPGDRALLLYPPGLDFIEAFFGCLYAGIVAIPAYPPDPMRLARTLPRLRAMAEDARPSLALTTSALLGVADEVVRQAPELNAIERLATDLVDDGAAADWRHPAIGGDAFAFLQYTSGSTTAPKGVMLTHTNLLRNHEMMQQAFQFGVEYVCAGWLPIYHDMGLIGQTLLPLYNEGRCVFMAPFAFLQRPVRWLRAIMRHRATLSVAPNFAYELCVRKVTAEERATLDLGGWSAAMSGSEPVSYATMCRFVDAFSQCGFRWESFYPVYGLAEATLFVSGARPRR